MSKSISAPHTLVIATGNAGKLAEIQDLLSPRRFHCVAQTTRGVRSVAETGLSFVENALIKARHASQQTGLAALADDSGLCVDCLDGKPGIYSARFADMASHTATEKPHTGKLNTEKYGKESQDQKNNHALIEALTSMGLEQSPAQFHCVMVYLRRPDDPIPLIFQGIWSGVVTVAAGGQHGFGYDPHFWVPTHHCHAAELPLALKNRISHRGLALQQLVKALALTASGRATS